MTITKSVVGTHGAIVSYQIHNAEDVKEMLHKTQLAILNDTEEELLRQTAYIDEELKESIAGLREEVRSVDTGAFIRDITITNTGKKNGFSSYRIEAPNTEYDVFLEYGTDRILARAHYQQTANRTQDYFAKKVKERIVKAIDSMSRIAKGKSWRTELPEGF